MELQMQAFQPDHTVTWALFVLAIAAFALSGIATLWWHLAADNKRNRKKAHIYETVQYGGLIAGVALLIFAGAAWLFCNLSADEDSHNDTVNQIENEYGFSMSTAQRKLISSALSDVNVYGITGIEDGDVEYTDSKMNPYQEPVPMGSVWIERDDGSLVKATFSFMLKKTDSDDTKVFELMMMNDTEDTIKRISPEEVREYAANITVSGDVASLFDTAAQPETQSGNE